MNLIMSSSTAVKPWPFRISCLIDGYVRQCTLLYPSSAMRAAVFCSLAGEPEHGSSSPESSIISSEGLQVCVLTGEYAWSISPVTHDAQLAVILKLHTGLALNRSRSFGSDHDHACSTSSLKCMLYMPEVISCSMPTRSFPAPALHRISVISLPTGARGLYAGRPQRTAPESMSPWSRMKTFVASAPMLCPIIIMGMPGFFDNAHSDTVLMSSVKLFQSPLYM